MSQRASDREERERESIDSTKMNKRENAKSNWQKKKIDGQVDEGVIGWGEREIKQKK